MVDYAWRIEDSNLDNDTAKTIASFVHAVRRGDRKEVEVLMPNMLLIIGVDERNEQYLSPIDETKVDEFWGEDNG